MTGVLIALEEAILDALAEDRTVQLDGVELSHPGHLRAPFYFPVPGNYGVTRD